MTTKQIKGPMVEKTRQVNVTKGQHQHCPMRVVITWDEYRFCIYLDRNAGSSEHTGHQRRYGTSMPARLLRESDKEETRHAVKISVQQAAAATATNRAEIKP